MKYYCLVLFILTTLTTLQGQETTLNDIAKRYLKEYKVPGMAISVVKPDTIFFGVAGIKHCGKPGPITLASKFHIGSNGKAITAMIAAHLVEENKLKWTSKITELIPELKGEIKPDYGEVTLESLLTNRGMIQPFEDDGSKEWKNIPNSIGKSSDSKLAFARYALNLDPKINPSKNHSYSNGGFVIAGLMLERASGKKWEELISTFNQKFEIGSFVGFPNQELNAGTFGHRKKMGKFKAIPAEEEQQFDFDFSPAGNLSINIKELATIMEKHLSGLLGMDNVLKSETYQYLHFGFEDYALGWYNGKIGDTTQKFSYHGGSLGSFSSAIMLSADREIAIIILINADGKKVNELKEEVRTTLWERYGTK